MALFERVLTGVTVAIVGSMLVATFARVGDWPPYATALGGMVTGWLGALIFMVMPERSR